MCEGRDRERWRPAGADGRGELGPGSLHLVGRLRASEESARRTKRALCEISGGHQEGPTALFSQSEPVCFLWASELEPVRRAACWQGCRLLGSEGGGFPDRVGRGLQGLLNILFDYICLLNAVRD